MKRNVVSAAGTCLVVLILGLQGCGDNPLRSRIIKLTTLARNGQAVYVSTDGNDSNLGTVELPKLTIAAAIKVFADEGLTGTVKVSEGSYKVDPFGGSSIEMVEGVSVAGGFSRDFASNDPTAHETIIQDSSGGPFQDGAFPSAVSFGAGITAQTVLSGFTVIGGTGQLSQGIRVEESSPTIENCIVRGGSPTADPGAWTHASGIYALNAGPTLSRCTITGSSNADAWFSAGITLEGATDFSVSDSTITSGLATRATSGVSMTDGSKGSMTAVSISSSPSELSQGVTVEGGSDLSIGDSTISAGGGATKVARGINLNGSMLAAGGDNISAGPATVDSCGVFVDSDESWSVSKSKVVAGVASTSRGIAVNGGGGGAVDGSTVVSGGSGTTTSHAIYLHSGNSKVTNNTIVSGAGESAWGIFLDNVAAAWISDNRIFGGQGAVSFGIRAATNSSDWSSITRNLIYGGSGDYSVAVSLQATNAVVWNNLIHGGGGTAALPTLGTRGLEVQDGTVRIINNTIFSGGLTNSSFGIACVPAQPEIVNNIIFVGVDNEKAIFSSQTLTSAVQNNLFYAYSGTMQAYQDQESNYVYGINELSNFSNNISGDPAFLDTDGSDNDIMTAEDNDWHLSAATSLGVREGGIPVQLPDQFDLEQVRRTAPWSIGGYEYD